MKTLLELVRRALALRGADAVTGRRSFGECRKVDMPTLGSLAIKAACGDDRSIEDLAQEGRRDRRSV
jgi:hypothetical protein